MAAPFGKVQAKWFMLAVALEICKERVQCVGFISSSAHLRRPLAVRSACPSPQTLSRTEPRRKFDVSLVKPLGLGACIVLRLPFLAPCFASALCVEQLCLVMISRLRSRFQLQSTLPPDVTCLSLKTSGFQSWKSCLVVYLWRNWPKQGVLLSLVVLCFQAIVWSRFKGKPVKVRASAAQVTAPGDFATEASLLHKISVQRLISILTPDAPQTCHWKQSWKRSALQRPSA